MMNDLSTIAGGKLRYTLHRGQAKAWRSEARFTFVIAGTQGGKTSFAPLWLWREINRAGHGDYLAATSSYDLFKLKFLPEMRGFFVTALRWHEDKSDRVLWRQYKPRMFDRIILRSAQSEGGLESSTVKGAVLDECGQDEFRIESWEAIQRRLSLSCGRVLGATTPYNLGWLKTEVFDRWRSGDRDYSVIQFRSIDNPKFPREEYDRMKRTLPAWKFEMFYNGQFTRPAGMIYEDYNEDIHCIDRFEIPPEWPRYVGVDFGAVHTSTVWLAQNPATNVYYLYRESLQGSMTSKQHAEWMLDQGKAENVVRYTGGAPSEDQQRADFTEGGVYITRPPIADVEAGIDRVIAMLKNKTIRIFKDCSGIKDEIGTYARKLDAYGQPTDEIKDKAKFHRLDSLRYCVLGLSDWIMSSSKY